MSLNATVQTGCAFARIGGVELPLNDGFRAWIVHDLPEVQAELRAPRVADANLTEVVVGSGA